MLFLFLSITAVSASDLNQTDAADFKIDSSEVSEILYDEESGCCYFIIQEEGNETVYGFRQDSPLNGNGVKINNQTWNGMDIIRQRD